VRGALIEVPTIDILIVYYSIIDYSIIVKRRRRAGTRAGGRKSAGEVPSPLRPPPGCHFHPRCPHAMARCGHQEPGLTNVDGRLVACHLYAPDAASMAPA